MAKQKNSGVRFQTVTKSEKQVLAQRGQQVGQFRDQRRPLETKGGNTATPKSGELMAATKVEHAKSPIVGKSANRLGKGNAPPAALRKPKLAANDQPKADSTGRQPGVDQANPLPEPRKTSVGLRDSKAQPEPRKAQPQPRKAQPQPEPRKAQPQPQPRKAQPQPAAKQPGSHNTATDPKEKDRKKKGKE